MPVSTFRVVLLKGMVGMRQVLAELFCSGADHVSVTIGMIYLADAAIQFSTMKEGVQQHQFRYLHEFPLYQLVLLVFKAERFGLADAGGCFQSVLVIGG